MRYGYWLPVFGGWLRNVEDEGMEASWNYVKHLAQRSEELGYDLTLIAELFLNDIKGIDAPSLDARQVPSASKFSSANPIGSIRTWQLAQTGFLRCTSIRSRKARGCPLSPASFNVGTSGGGGGGGDPSSASSSHLPRSTGEVRLGYDVAVSTLA